MSMVKQKKDFETIRTSLSKSNNANDVVDTPTSKDNNSVIIKVYLFAILVFMRMLSSFLL